MMVFLKGSRFLYFFSCINLFLLDIMVFIFFWLMFLFVLIRIFMMYILFVFNLLVFCMGFLLMFEFLFVMIIVRFCMVFWLLFFFWNKVLLVMCRVLEVLVIFLVYISLVMLFRIFCFGFGLEIWVLRRNFIIDCLEKVSVVIWRLDWKFFVFRELVIKFNILLKWCGLMFLEVLMMRVIFRGLYFVML